MKKNLKLVTQIIPAVALLLLAAFGLQHSAPVFPPLTATAAAVETETPQQTVPKPEKKAEDTAAAEESANNVTPGTGDYQDGTYTGTGNGFHGPVKVQVTVKDKQITDITILSFEDDDSFFGRAKEGVIASILTAQTWEVDSVSGASYSSRGIKEAVQNALTGAVSTSSSPVAAAADGPVQLADVTPGTGNYVDGVHTGTGTGFRGPVTVKVTVKNQQITDIAVVSYKDDSSFFNRAKALITSIKTAQTWNVDSVSGASYSSRGIKEAVRNALTGSTSTSAPSSAASASANKKKPTSSSFTAPKGGYKDGTYYGTATGFGGPVKTKVVIKNGKIASVAVVSAPKETSTYLNRAKAITSRIISKQSPNVDTVSGATYSSNAIREGVKKALKQAAGKKVTSNDSSKKKDDSQTTVKSSGKKLSGSYKNGTYTGSAKGFGGDIQVKVTIKNNAITKIVVAKAAKETPSFLTKAKGKVIPLILSKQTTKVDGASGATYSSNGIKNAVAAALKKAKTGSAQKEDDSKKDDADKKEETPKPSGKKLSGSHKDGTYTGTGKGYRDGLKVKVTIKDNAITKLEIGDNNETASFLEKAKEKVLAEILSKQTTSVDAASGATRSSNGIMAAVADALKKAETGDTSDDSKTDNDKKDEDEKKDDEQKDDEQKDDDKKDEDEKEDDEQKEEKKRNGTYTGTATVNPDKYEDFSRYTLTIRVKFTDGKVTSISNLTIKGADPDEEDDDEYYSTMASDKLFSQIKSKNGTDGVDAVSGATCSSKAIKEAFQDAAKQADKALEE